MRRPVRWRSALACVVCTLAMATTARSQDNRPATGAIDGRVRDAAGRAVAGAELTIQGTTIRVETDDAGEVRIKNVPAGDLELRIRRLGFRPDTSRIRVQAGQTVPVLIALQPLAFVLSPVMILGKRYSGRLAAFYERRDRGMGHYFTREEIERRNPAITTDLLRTVPGVRIQTGSFGRQTLRFRGSRCPPLVWVDGAPLGASEFDINSFSARSIEAMEIYSGVDMLPAEFNGPSSGCGAIVIWSRQGEVQARHRPKGESAAAEVQRLVESLSVYTAEQVDQPARADSTRQTLPVYPHELYRNATPGSVLVEFVVDPDGQADMDSFNVVSATHPAFGESVRRAVRETTWIPAVKQGRKVRQVLQLPYRFVPDSIVKRGT